MLNEIVLECMKKVNRLFMCHSIQVANFGWATKAHEGKINFTFYMELAKKKAIFMYRQKKRDER